MEQGSKKGNPSLSIDRAAFLLLRVKKAFKRKRQQRKERQAQQAAAALGVPAITYKRVGPPPLLRSRTLPAIIVPGISILQAQIDPNHLSAGEFDPSSFGPCVSFCHPKSAGVSTPSIDKTLEVRRKSSGSGSTYSGNQFLFNTNADPHIYACEDFERHPDGSVVIRIPAHQVLASRSYRLSTGNVSFLGSKISSDRETHSNSVQPTAYSNSNDRTPLYRIAKLLNQTSRTIGQQNSILKDDAPRRLSWERRNNNGKRMPRSGSIDSMVEAVCTNSPRILLDVPQIIQHHTNLLQAYPFSTNFGSFSGSYSSRRESILSPSSGRRSKQNRGVAESTLYDLITQLYVSDSVINKYQALTCTGLPSNAPSEENQFLSFRI